MRSYLVGGLSFILIGMALFSPIEYGLWAYWWIGFFRPDEWATDNFVVEYKISLVLALILVARGMALGKIKRVNNIAVWSMAVIVLGGSVAHLNAYNPELSQKWLENFASIAIISTVAISLINSERKLFVSVAIIAVSIGYHSGKAGMMAVIGGNEITSGYGGPFPDNNGFALAAAVVVPLLIICLMTNRLSGKIKIATNIMYALLAIGSCLTVIKTGSRGGSVALAAGMLLFLILEKPKAHILYIFLIVIGVYAFSDLMFTEEYMNRMQTILNYRDVGEQSAISRLHFWAVAERVFVNNPLGVGFFNFGYAYDMYDTTDGLHGRTRPVHNTHLQMLTEGGLIGAIGWAIAILGAFTQNLKIIIAERAAENINIRLIRAYSKGVIVSIVVFVIGSSFGNYAYNELIWTILAISCANGLNYQERKAFLDPTCKDLMKTSMMK